MRRHLGRLGIGFVILALLASVFWWRTMTWSGQLRGIHPHFDGQCQSAAPIVGAEDLVIDHAARMVFVSSQDRRNVGRMGSIWMVPVDQFSNAREMQITGMQGAGFAPHGLDLFVAADGTQYLFVIDHAARPKHLVRKFKISGAQLVLVDTYESPEFYSPNDVSAVGENQFYLTNDNRQKRGSVAAFLAALFRTKTGNVVWVDGKTVQSVAGGFAYANGIAATKTRVYVNETVGQNLHIFERNAQLGALTPVEIVPLLSGLDNIDIAQDGSLWIGAHPRLFDFAAHAKDANKQSPSQVLRVDPNKHTIAEIYVSAGPPLNGVSVAAKIDDLLFLGGVFDTNLLACHLNLDKNDHE